MNTCKLFSMQVTFGIQQGTWYISSLLTGRVVCIVLSTPFMYLSYLFPQDAEANVNAVSISS